MKIVHEECGQTTILVALCLLAICGLAGFAVDAGMMFRAKRILQIAADSAAVSGAAELNYGDGVAAAQAAATQNGVTDGVAGASVAVNSPPLYGPMATKPGYVEVIVSQNEPTYFMSLFHLTSLTVGARAVAAVEPSASCVDTLTPTRHPATESRSRVQRP